MNAWHIIVTKIREARDDDGSHGEITDRLLRQQWSFVVVIVLLLALSALRLFLLIRGTPVNSDNALPMILFESLRKGLGSGWFFVSDNYLISNFPFYVVSALIFGPTASTIWGTAIALSSFSLLIIMLGLRRAIGQMGALIFAIFWTVPFILGNAAYGILSQPFIHVMTIGFSIWLASLIITGFFDSSSINWPKLTALGVLASFVEMSDPFLLFILLIPLVIVGLWYTVSNRVRKSALWASIFIIDIVVLLSVLERLIIEHFGNVILPLNTNVVPYNLLGFHVELMIASALNLLGVNFIGLKLGVPFLLDLVKLAALGYFLIYTIYKYRTKRLETPRQAFIAYTVVMSVIIVFAFVLSSQPVDIYAQRYLFPAIIGILILISMGVADHLRRYKRVFLAILLLSGMYTAISIGAIHPNVQPSPYAQLAQELENKHIQYGYAGYWHANAVTFASDQKVRIRAVVKTTDDKVEPYDWVTNSQWYKPGFFTGPTCLILSPWLRTLNVKRLESYYGKPSEVFFVRGMEVLVWPYNISERFP